MQPGQHFGGVVHAGHGWVAHYDSPPLGRIGVMQEPPRPHQIQQWHEGRAGMERSMGLSQTAAANIKAPSGGVQRASLDLPDAPANAIVKR